MSPPITFPIAGAVEFAEVDALPAAQQGLVLVNYDGLGWSHQAGFLVGGIIPCIVSENIWHKSCQILGIAKFSTNRK